MVCFEVYINAIYKSLYHKTIKHWKIGISGKGIISHLEL
jgi:hypothetical protein